MNKYHFQRLKKGKLRQFKKLPYDKVFRVIIYKIYHEEARNSNYKLLALNGYLVKC